MEVGCVLVSLRMVVWGRSWLRGRDRVLSESEPGPGWAGLNHVDVTKWSNGGRLRGVRVGAVRWAWRNNENVTRSGRCGSRAERQANGGEVGVDALSVRYV